MAPAPPRGIVYTCVVCEVDFGSPFGLERHRRKSRSARNGCCILAKQKTFLFRCRFHKCTFKTRRGALHLAMHQRFEHGTK